MKFLREFTTKATISVLSEIVLEEGVPRVIVSDNGTQLVSREMQSFLVYNGITHNRTSLYNPMGNGLVERAHRLLKGTIQLA